MKTNLLILILFCALISGAQKINLPVYEKGKHETTTLLTYFGNLPKNGIATINFGGSFPVKLPSGIHFKLVVDSTNQGTSPTHTAFWDSAGKNIPVYKQDTLTIPLTVRVFAGTIGFHIIIEGTPLIENEVYSCDLQSTYTTGDDWGMLIINETGKNCTVAGFGNVHNNYTPTKKCTVHPNPFSTYTTIELDNGNFEASEIVLFDVFGSKVKSIENITGKQLQIDRANLAPGIYFFQINSRSNKPGDSINGKLVIE